MWGGGGEIRLDVGSKASDKVIIKTTPGQDRIYQNYLDNLDVSEALLPTSSLISPPPPHIEEPSFK
jgi:hypothetical protein